MIEEDKSAQSQPVTAQTSLATSGSEPSAAQNPQAVERGIECIGYALAAYAKARGTRLADHVDLLTDLFHFADQGGEDCEQLARDALANWRDER